MKGICESEGKDRKFSDDERSRIYLEYYDKVNGYVRGKIADPHEAEDVVSSVFLRVFEHFDSYDPSRASISTWIYRITHNAVVDYYRSRKIYVEYADYMDGEIDEIIDADDEEALLEQLADSLMLLKEKERDLIVLHYYKGYTLKRIADMMGMSYVNAKVIHAKALAHLREYMKI